MHCGNCIRNFFRQQKYTNAYRHCIYRAMHKTSVLLHAATINTNAAERASVGQTRSLIKDGLSLRDFIEPSSIDIPTAEPIPYVQDIHGDNQKGIVDICCAVDYIFMLCNYYCCFILVYFEIYGCQMNVNDTEVIWSILKAHGYQHTKNIEDANIALLVTCSIRDNAEQKVWNKLQYLNGIRNKRRRMLDVPMKIGLLGELC